MENLVINCGLSTLNKLIRRTYLVAKFLIADGRGYKLTVCNGSQPPRSLEWSAKVKRLHQSACGYRSKRPLAIHLFVGRSAVPHLGDTITSVRPMLRYWLLLAYSCSFWMPGKHPLAVHRNFQHQLSLIRLSDTNSSCTEAHSTLWFRVSWSKQLHSGATAVL